MDSEPRQGQWTEGRESEVRELYLEAKAFLENGFDVQLTPIEAVNLRHIIREKILPVLRIDESRVVQSPIVNLEKQFGEKWYEHPDALAKYHTPQFQKESDESHKRGKINQLIKLQDPAVEAARDFVINIWGISDIDEVKRIIGDLSKTKTAEEFNRIKQKYIEFIQNLRLESRGYPEIRES